MPSPYLDTLFELPTALLVKPRGDESFFISPALACQFNTQPGQVSHRLSDWRFYATDNLTLLSGDQHPVQLAEQSGELCQRCIVAVAAMRCYCVLHSKVTHADGQDWLLIRVAVHSATDPSVAGPVASSLAEHVNFSMLLSSLSTRLINAHEDDVDRLIEDSLASFGNFLQAHRCYLFSFSKDKHYMDNTHEWVAPGVAPFKQELQQVPLTALPYFARIIQQKQVFVVDDVSLLPAEACLEKAEFEREDIGAVLCVAVVLNDDLFGFIGCDILAVAHRWTQYEIQHLKLIGEMVSETLQSVKTRCSLHRLQQELLRANQTLEVLVNLDGLTQIANRRHFDEALSRAWHSVRTDGGQLSLLMLDVDFFKRYNDSHGHQAGDITLKRIAQAIDDIATLYQGTAARYGGEEFAVILPHSHRHHASQVAQAIMSAVRALSITFHSPLAENYVTVSIGLATNQDADTSGQLVAYADQALYQAKLQGRNQVVVFQCPRQAHSSPA